MRHALMYQGAYETNYPDLKPGATMYQGTDGSEHHLPPWPASANGLRVGYMERTGKKFVAVRLQYDDQDVVLKNALVIDPMRHLGSRRLAPEPTLVTDDLASAILDDAIQLNPEQSTDLAKLISRVNQARRGA